MDIKSWLDANTKKLEAKKISSARLDCLILLEDILNKDRSWILAHTDDLLNEKVIKNLNSQISRRKNYEPLAYIRGKSEFYGRTFLVTPDTLQPRQETETMLSLLLEIMRNDPETDGSVIIDIGTGSGCLAITASLELPYAKVLATEINRDALKVAQRNATKHNAQVVFYKGDLLRPIPKSVIKKSNIIIMANLPYVPDSHTINKPAMQEPKIAIFGGTDGLDLYKKMFNQIDKLPKKPSYILTESLPFQHGTLKDIAIKHEYRLEITENLIQLFFAK